MSFRKFLNSLSQELQGPAGGFGGSGGFGGGGGFGGYGSPGPSSYMYGQSQAAPQQAVPCQRKQPQAGFQDWIGLNDPRFPHFLMCPSCYNSLVRPTPYANYFVTKAVHPTAAIRCDMSRFWVSMAGLVLTTMNQDNRYDVTLLARAASIAVPEGPCPNSQLQHEEQPMPVVRRSWTSLIDPQSRTWLLQGWTICSSCTAAIQTLLPNLAPGFAVEGGGPREATCALVPSDAYTDARTAQISQFLATGAVMTAMTRRHDVNALLEYLRSNPPPTRGGGGEVGGSGEAASNGLCPRNRPSTVLKCHMMVGLGDFTVCEQCFADVIKPDLEKGVDIARQFDSTPSAIPSGFTCQLYSDRMRRVWSDCAASSNMDLLGQKVNERRSKERELQLKTTQLRTQAQQLREQASVQEHLAVNAFRVEANRVNNNIFLSGVGVTYDVDAYHYRRPDTSANFTPTTQMNNQAAMLKIQAAQAEDQIKMAEDEWRRFWE